jgi:uncharacterized protein (TIGR02646 family)
MIQIVKKATAPAPAVLLNQGNNATLALQEGFDNGELDFEFDTQIYGHNDVKSALVRLQDEKCCFCESRITHISYGDVEHFRPKAGWVQVNERLNKPGYYWLAYEWNNLLLSCDKCNRRYKKNYFPISDTTQRALSHHYNIAAESPIFVHPVLENPEAHITFDGAAPKHLTERGRVTIEKLGLDRRELNEVRLESLNKVRDIYFLANNTPATTVEIKRQALLVIYKYFNESQLPQTQYSAMLKAFFRDNPLPPVV